MCMIYGFSGGRKYELNKSLNNFFKYSNKHPHGWGVATFESINSNPLLIKQAKPAYSSVIAQNLIKSSVPGQIAIGHIRYATIGSVSYLNTHPFIKTIDGIEWVFAHNGSVELDEIKNVTIKAEGETDSERVFCYIIEKLKRLKINSLKESIKIIENSIERLSVYGKLNLIFSDGEHLFVHSNYADSLYVYNKNGVACFCTKPLNDIGKDIEWKAVKLNRLFIYKNGIQLYEGLNHGNQYFKPGRRMVV